LLYEESGDIEMAGGIIEPMPRKEIKYMKKIVFAFCISCFGAIGAAEWNCDTFGKVVFDAEARSNATYAKGTKTGSWKVEVLSQSDDGIESSGTWTSADGKESGALFMVKSGKKVSGKYGKGEEEAKRKFNCKVVK
jgi:hypothetical protein